MVRDPRAPILSPRPRHTKTRQALLFSVAGANFQAIGGIMAPFWNANLASIIAQQKNRNDRTNCRDHQQPSLQYSYCMRSNDNSCFGPNRGICKYRVLRNTLISRPPFSRLNSVTSSSHGQVPISIYYYCIYSVDRSGLIKEARQSILCSW